MDRREFSQSIAVPGAAIAVPLDIATMSLNAETGDVPIRFGAAARGAFHD
jgi:hypothetical protein